MRTGTEIRAARLKSSRSVDAEPPVVPKKIVVSYARSRRRWIDAGKPVREPEAVKAILDGQCKPCVNYIKQTENTGRCRLCTCQLNLGTKLNKIYWATEGCPDDPPKWPADINEEQAEVLRTEIRSQQRQQQRAMLLERQKLRRERSRKSGH